MSTDLAGLWDRGMTWGPDANAARWEPAEADTTARPRLRVYIGGRLANEDAYEARWRLGTSTWFDQLAPGGGTVKLRGRHEPAEGATVELRGPYGPLFSGWVTGSHRHRTRDGWESTVTFHGVLGRMGQAQLTAVELFGSDPVQQADYLLSVAGLGTGRCRDLYTPAYLWPTVEQALGVAEFTGSPLQRLQTIADAVNAAVMERADGTLAWLARGAFPTSADLAVWPLEGFDAPTSWREASEQSDVLNRWRIVNSGVSVLSADDAPSQALHGLRSYDLADTIGSDAGAWSASMRAVMARLRTRVPECRIPVTDARQAALRVAPLDAVEHEGTRYQVLGVEHDVTRDGWTAALQLDVAHELLSGDPAPPDPEPAPGYHVELQTLACTKDTQVSLAADGTARGAGTGANLACGLWAGWRRRILLDFATVTFPAGTRRVISAKLIGWTSGQVQVAFGAAPRVYAERIVDTWAEGTEAADSTANATTWANQPDVTRDGRHELTVPDTNDVEWTREVTGIVAAWFAGKPQRGIRIRSVDESSKRYTWEMKSAEGFPAKAVQLVVRLEVED